MDPQAQRLIGFAGAIIIAFLLGYGLRSCTHECPTVPQVAASTIKTDTVEVLKVIEHEPIYVHAKARVVFDTIKATDTIYTTRAFTATLDTIVRRDTMSFAFRYPEQEFRASIKQAADSIKVEYVTVTLTNTTHEKREWWIDLFTHLGAASVGVGIGSLIR